jgi:hypothetical protein
MIRKGLCAGLWKWCATPQAVTIANDQVLFPHQPTVAWFVCNFVNDPFVIQWSLMTVAITLLFYFL